MKEQFGNKVKRMRYLLFLLGILGMMIQGGDVYGQTFKRYFKNLQSASPQQFFLKDMVFNPALTSVIVGGEFRGSNNSLEAYGFTFEIGMDGMELSNHALVIPTSNTMDGFNMGGIAVDFANRRYISGSYATNFSQPSSSTEKTISGLEADGKLRWSRMEGSRHFSDVVFDPDDQSLIAIGGPDGSWGNSQPISVVKMELDGNDKIYKTIFDPAQNQAIKVLDLPNDKGYFVTAIYDTAGLKAPYLIYLDRDLRLRWAYLYSDFLTEYTVSDASYHPDGLIGLTGTAYDPITEERKAFLMGIHPDGSLKFSYQFGVQLEGETEGYGLTYVKHSSDPNINGFMLAGSYAPLRTTVRRQSLIIQTNFDGKPVWARDFSHLPPQDFEEDEIAKQIIFLEGRDMFVAAGEYAQYFQGIQRERFMWMAKANIKTGDLQDERQCSTPVMLTIKVDSLGAFKAGRDTSGGSLMNFTYPTTTLPYSGQSCSYSFIEDGIRTDVLPNLPSAQQADRIEIYDLTGRRLLEADIRDQSWKHGLVQGVYLRRFLKGNTILYAEKFVLP